MSLTGTVTLPFQQLEIPREDAWLPQGRGKQSDNVIEKMGGVDFGGRRWFIVGNNQCGEEGKD